MGLCGKVPPDQQRFLQAGKIGPGCRRNRIDAACGQVGAQDADGCQPEIEQEKITRQQHGDQSQAAMGRISRVSRPALPFQTENIEGE